MTQQDCFIPLVPYESKEEYTTLLYELKNEYNQMVQIGINKACLRGWCLFHHGLSWGVKSHWMEHGTKLFLKLTKGNGIQWCETVNTLVVHSLDTAVRVGIEIFEWHDNSMTGTEEDKKILSKLLEREVSCAIADDNVSPNNMDSFYDENFKCYTMWSCKNDNEVYYYPIQKFKDIQLAFVMGQHGRLGKDSSVSMLSKEMITLIFSDRMF